MATEKTIEWYRQKTDGTGLALVVGAVRDAVGAGFTVTPSSFELAKDKWTECTATITGEGLLALTFSPVKRLFLDEVLLMDATYNGIGEMKPAMHIDNAVYNLQGVRMNADSLPRGIYIKNGKKIVIK